jgi:formate dehydrogenase subunit beta
MSPSYLLTAHNGDRRALVNSILKGLLASGQAQAVYTLLRAPQGAQAAPALVCDPVLLDQADPVAPVMLINGARAVAALTVGDAPAQIAVVLRSCEIRALIELTKLKQANL